MENEVRVIIVQEMGHDYRKAKNFGKIISYSRQPVNIFSHKELDNFSNWLNENVKQEDFLLFSGNILLNCIAFNFMVSKFGRIKYLTYNQKSRNYKAAEFHNVD